MGVTYGVTYKLTQNYINPQGANSRERKQFIIFISKKKRKFL